MAAAQPHNLDPIDPLDPIDEIRLTAYALGELDAADRAAVEAHLSANRPGSAAARRYVDEVRATARLLSGELAREINFGLTALQHEVIEQHLHRLEHPELAGPRLDLRRWTTAGLSMAAALLIVGGVAAALLPRLLAPFPADLAADQTQPQAPAGGGGGIVQLKVYPPRPEAPREPALAEADGGRDSDLPERIDSGHFEMPGVVEEPLPEYAVTPIEPPAAPGGAGNDDAVAAERRPVGIGRGPDADRPVRPRLPVFADGRKPHDPRDVPNAKVTAVLTEDAIAGEPATTGPTATQASPGASPGGSTATVPSVGSTRQPTRRAVELREYRRNRDRHQITHQLNTMVERARAATAKQDVVVAARHLDAARLARFKNPIVFEPEELRRFDAAIREAQRELDAAAEQARKRAAAEAERRRTVAALTRSARKLTEERRYAEALGVIDQILALDPRNDYAGGVRPLVEEKVRAKGK